MIIPPGFGTCAETERAALQWAQDNNVPVANIAGLFRHMNESERPRMYLPHGHGHYSPTGHRLIADEIAHVIRQGTLLPSLRSGGSNRSAPANESPSDQRSFPGGAFGR